MATTRTETVRVDVKVEEKPEDTSADGKNGVQQWFTETWSKITISNKTETTEHTEGEKKDGDQSPKTVNDHLGSFWQKMPWNGKDGEQQDDHHDDKEKKKDEEVKKDEDGKSGFDEFWQKMPWNSKSDDEHKAQNGDVHRSEEEPADGNKSGFDSIWQKMPWNGDKKADGDENANTDEHPAADGSTNGFSTFWSKTTNLFVKSDGTTETVEKHETVEKSEKVEVSVNVKAGAAAK